MADTYERLLTLSEQFETDADAVAAAMHGHSTTADREAALEQARETLVALDRALAEYAQELTRG